ncbi:MAG: tRNA (adenosine(37)-N6)-threonylcarbamoyltransferase complex ATPase subunit type 1 TsaE [Spirochaetales bacterium]|nr:tRNA (adenosine(37)-N6)-threonylcarbamoyltransferase complex ATPase subunit type 1 TsaE [Spirochaetales bacterium]
MKTFKATTPEEIIKLGKKIGKALRANSVIAMEGTLGAGKTTMTKGIAEGLGIVDNVTSPTFTIISEYYGKTPLYHMDFYRVDSIEEFDLLGAEELFYADGVCVVEWFGKILERMPKDYITIKISIDSDNSRIVEVSNFDF